VSFRLRACSGIAALAALSAAAASEDWQTAFPRSSVADRNIYFQARYLDANGAEHRQEVWREGSTRLRRVSDDRLDLLVERDADGEYQYRLADRERHIMVLADRTSLYRAGIFSDWEGLAHALSEPRTPYELTTSDGVPDRSGIAPCLWTTMTSRSGDQPVSRICWSAEWGLPLSVQIRRGDDWVTQFAITEARIFEPSDALFQADPAGYIEMDTRAGDDLAD
jgi:hypothetical protein